MSKIKRLAGDTVLYGLGSIIPRTINFFLTWLHTRVFSNPEEYGVITNFYAYIAFLNIIYSFGMETAYFRFASKPGADPKRIFNLAQTVIVTIGILLSVSFILLAKPLANQFNIPTHSNYVVWLTLVMFFDSIVALPFAKLRLERKPLQYALAKIINILLYVGLNLFFLTVIYNPTLGIGYVFLANVLANAFFIIYFAKTLLQWRPAFDKEISPQMFKYAYPVMLTGLAGTINEMFSRTTLQWWLPKNFYPGKSSEYALGIFGACYKLGMLMSLAIQAFRFAAEPFFFSHASDKNSPLLFARVNHYFVIICCILLISVSINLDLLKYFLGDPKYWAGLSVVPILLLSYLFLGIYYNLTVWFKLTDKTYYGTFITVGGAILTIVANYFLIPVAGYVGSSVATLLCYAVMMVACYLLGQKFYPIPYKVAADLSYILITCTLIYVINNIKIENQMLAISFHAGIIFIYLTLIFLFERKQFRQSIS